MSVEADTIRRVLMTADTVGGVWTFAVELARALTERGIEVILATLGGKPNSAQLDEIRSLTGVQIVPSDYKLEWMADPWKDLEDSCRWIRDLEIRCSPDVVHLNSYGHGSVAWNAPVVLTAHSCVVSWWNAVKTEPIGPEWNRYRDTVHCALNSADVITAPSRAMVRTLLKNYSTDPSKTYAVANGRDPSIFKPGLKEPFILTAGRLWDEAKNAAAVAQLADRLSWPVYLAGNGTGPDGIKKILPGCRVLGRLSTSEMADCYSRAGIYALPALYEPFGLSVLEAALSGCALVLGDIPSLRENWDGAARFVDPRDPGNLEFALEELIQNETVRAELAEAAWKRAQRFTPGRMVEGYLTAYQKAVSLKASACVA